MGGLQKCAKMAPEQGGPEMTSGRLVEIRHSVISHMSTISTSNGGPTYAERRPLNVVGQPGP
jgi:hypothetical protein